MAEDWDLQEGATVAVRKLSSSPKREPSSKRKEEGETYELGGEIQNSRYEGNSNKHDGSNDEP